MQLVSVCVCVWMFAFHTAWWDVNRGITCSFPQGDPGMAGPPGTPGPVVSSSCLHSISQPHFHHLSAHTPGKAMCYLLCNEYRTTRQLCVITYRACTITHDSFYFVSAQHDAVSHSLMFTGHLCWKAPAMICQHSISLPMSGTFIEKKCILHMRYTLYGCVIYNL